MESVLKWTTLGSTALFAGWALYISLVEHPARLAAGAAVGIAQFRQSYKRAAPWQASAALVSLVGGVLCAVVSGDPTWALAGTVVAIVIPFTLLIVMPINRRLFDDATPEREAGRELQRWGRLHLVRTLLGLAGLFILMSRVSLR